MAIIGTFIRGADSKLSGSLKTLTLSSKLQFAPEINKSCDKAPDFRIFLGSIEVAAAWQRTAKESGRDYWSSSLTIRLSLHRFTPAWSRPRTARP